MFCLGAPRLQQGDLEELNAEQFAKRSGAHDAHVYCKRTCCVQTRTIALNLQHLSATADSGDAVLVLIRFGPEQTFTDQLQPLRAQGSD
jgi:hypothetical protein